MGIPDARPACRRAVEKLIVRMTHYSWKVKQEHSRIMLAQQVAQGHVTIGKHTYGLQSTTISGASALASVDIGSFCSFAPGVSILANVDHPLDRPSTYPFVTLLFGANASCKQLPGFNADAITKGPVTIGHDVWVGQSAIIMSGISIGTGCVVGAGAVLTKSLPPYSIAVGNPARIVRKRFSEEIIAEILQCRWWELSDDDIQSLLREFYATDIRAFIDAVSQRPRLENMSHSEL